MPLIFAMSTALPDECWETLPERRQEAVAALQRGDRRAQARGGEELERRQHAAVDLAGADVAGGRRSRPRCAGWRARAGPAPPCSSAGSGRSTAAWRPGRRTGSCRPRGRSRSTRAASSRRGSASGRCAGRRGRPGGSRTARAAALRARGLADAAEDRAGDDARARAQALDADVLAVEAEDLREVALEARAAVDLAGALEVLLLAAGARRRWAAAGWRTGAAWWRRRLRGAAWRPACARLARLGLAALRALGRLLGRSTRRARSARRPWPGARAPWRPACAVVVRRLRRRVASSRPSPGARTCRCCRRRPGAGRSGRGARCGRRGRSCRR